MSSFDCFIYSRLIDTNSQCRVTNGGYASYLKQAKKTGRVSIIQRLKDDRGKYLYYNRICKTELFNNLKPAVKNPLQPNLKKQRSSKRSDHGSSTEPNISLPFKDRCKLCNKTADVRKQRKERS